jgi:hypothetical protein
VLEGPNVNYDVEPLVEFFRNRLVEVVDDARALIRGRVDCLDLVCAK